MEIVMKRTFVLQACVNSYSGYGSHSRDIAKSLLKILDPDKWNFIIIPTLWGSTTDGALKERSVENKEIADHIIREPLKVKPDVFFQIGLPNEATPIGMYNILCTAGIESTLISIDWIEGCNKMDLIIVPSEHVANVFRKSKWEKRDSHTKEILETIVVKSKIAVLFEGVNNDIYFKTNIFSDNRIIPLLDKIESDFCFLVVGHWLPGDLYQDRKNIGATIKAFLKTFSHIPSPPGLIIKTAIVNSSVIDYHMCLERLTNTTRYIATKENIQNIPPIYLLHGDFTDSEMNELYNHPKIKCMVSSTRGEGYGRPLAEFSMVEKPIISSNWGGQLDFLSKDNTVLVKGDITPIHQSAVWDKVLLKEASWFSIDIDELTNKMGDVYILYNSYVQKAKSHTKYFKSKFLLSHMTTELKTIIDTTIPTELEFNF